jgi:hypothetical protein
MLALGVAVVHIGPLLRAAPKAGQLLGELENREFLCEPAVRALQGRKAREH